MTRAPKKVILMEKKNICYVKRKVLEFAKPNCVFSYLYYNVFSTFWGSRHPLELKKFGGTLTCQKMTIWGTLNSKALIKRQLILFQYLVAPLAPPYSILVHRGTLVGNHCSTRIYFYFNCKIYFEKERKSRFCDDSNQISCVHGFLPTSSDRKKVHLGFLH